MKKFRNWLLLLIAAVTAACLVCGPLEAKKPPKGGDNPPPPLPGTIVFRHNSAFWGMNADGTNQRRIGTQDFYGAPSSRVYGSDSHRWFLFGAPDGRVYDRVIDADGIVLATNIPHIELMVARFDADGNYVETRPVADSFGAVLFGWNAGGFDDSPPPYEPADLPSWSSDTQDSFVSWGGSDIRQAFTIEPDGTTTIDSSKGLPGRFIRLMVTGAEIEAGILGGPAQVRSVEAGGFQYTDYHWHPSGLFFIQANERADPAAGGYQYDIQMRDGTTGEVLWTRTSDLDWGTMSWSPVELDPDTHLALLVFVEDHQLKVMAADPTGYDAPKTIFTAQGAAGRVLNPVWSPDGANLVVSHEARRKPQTPTTAQTLRMTNTGEQVFEISGSLDPLSIDPFYWLTDDPPANP